MTLKIPFGHNRGELITECDDAALQWAIEAIDDKLCRDPNGRYSEDNKRWLDVAMAEQQRRRAGGSPVAAPLAKAVDRPALLAQVGVGAIREGAAASAALTKARELGHLISPAPTVGHMPEGCFVQVSAMLLDVNRETYQHSGSSERGLGKVALDRIAGMAAITWDPVLSRRLDSGQHPWYRHCKAVGRVRNFDGTWRELCDEKEIDLTDGSATVEGILLREKRKKQDEGTNYKGDGGIREIAMKRQHILSLCSTEARLRATRILGIRTGYTGNELQLPFVVAQLAFDGRSENPETARFFNEMIAQSFLGATAQLYGGASAPTRLPAPPAAPVIELPAAEDEGPWGPPDYGFVDLPKATGTDGGKY